MLVVGGTLQEWVLDSQQHWDIRVAEAGKVCSSVGIPWLTLRAYEIGDGPTVAMTQWTQEVDACTVVVDPCGDGRKRFADAMSRIDASVEVNEATVAAALYEPADSEPDLVVIVGPSTQLPPSLVWELAYAELVFVPRSWNEFDATCLAAAVLEFGSRRRRFGGLDDE